MSSDRLYSVRIPDNGIPGSKVHVQLDDGRIFEIIVPNGCYPGSVISIEVDDSIAGSVEQCPKEYSSASKALGVASVAGVATALVIGSPVLGVVAAGAAVYAATRSDGIGEASRAVGNATCTAADRANQYAKKYGVYDKLKSAGSATAAKLSEINQEYKVTDRVKDAGSQAVTQAQAIDTKYQISQRASTAIVQGAIIGAREVTKVCNSSSTGTTGTAAYK